MVVAGGGFGFVVRAMRVLNLPASVANGEVRAVRPRRLDPGAATASYSARVDSLERLTADVVACRACPRLVAWREQVATEKRAAYRDDQYWGRPVPGFGDPGASIVVVGLAPAAHGANRTGRMFTGDRSGEWLYRALWRAGLSTRPESVSADDGLELTGAYITAPVRCAPPANRPTIDERDRCRPFLERELRLLDRARVYVVLGQFGYQVLCGVLGVRPRPKFGHGVEVPLPAGEDRPARTMLCSYHVSQQNTFTGKLTEAMLDDVFRRARELAAEPR
jgi:uracil-DNA glycosylase family 4